MAKLTISNISGDYGSATAINNAFDAIETAIENTLSRDGTAPNTMSAELDMNSNDINNVNNISAQNVVRQGQSLVPSSVVAIDTASSVPNVPAGTVSATDVQGAIDELDSEKAALSGATFTGNIDLDSNKVIFDADGDTYIQSAADDYLRFVVYNNNPLDLRNDTASSERNYIATDGFLFHNAVATTGTGAAYTVDMSLIAGYVSNRYYTIRIHTDNTSATPTLAIGSGGAKTIKDADGNALPLGALKTGLLATFRYDGTDMLLMNPYKNIPLGALVYDASTQSISNTTLTTVDFDTEDYDTSAIHDTVTNNSRLTVPTGVTKVRLTGKISFAANSTGYRFVELYKNGSGTYAGNSKEYEFSPHASVPTILNITSPILTVAGGDYFELKVYQSSGGALDVSGGSNVSWFAMEILE